jgi:hypothetical protein
MTIYGAAINLETRVMKFNGGAIFFADTVAVVFCSNSGEAASDLATLEYALLKDKSVQYIGTTNTRT